jgi:hypothetical protein
MATLVSQRQSAEGEELVFSSKSQAAIDPRQINAATIAHIAV